MERAGRIGMLLLLIYLVSLSNTSKGEDDFSRCESLVREWAESSANNRIKEDKITLKDLLFFLHVPRTGGRSYYHCFLRNLYGNSDQCPRSYDKLHFDPREPKCRLLVSHDDYSLISKLSEEKTSVVTILRNPIDRVFSTYEFAVEVAARFLIHPNLTSAIQMSKVLASKTRGITTLDIWPWKYLVPWMREDLFSRRDVRKHTEVGKIRGMRNPYDMDELVMPLHAFIDDPISHEIIHNGATFQLAGLTNNSFLAESPKIRHCVRSHSVLGHYVLEVAKSRLDHMLYIGLTEDHKESATIFANMVGSQVLSQSKAQSSHAEVAFDETGTSSIQDSNDSSQNQNQNQNSSENQAIGDDNSSSNVHTTDKNMTVQKLMETYKMCIPSLQKVQAKRRRLSLRNITPVNFSTEARRRVSETVIQKISLLNSLDVDLYNYARNLFMEQQKNRLSTLNEQTNSTQKHLLSQLEMQQAQHEMYGYKFWRMLSLIFMSSFFIFGAVVLFTRRRASKIKV